MQDIRNKEVYHMIIRNNNLISGKVNSVRPSENQSRINTSDNNNQNNSFGKILNEKLQGNQDVKFSKHAEMRLKSRNIELTNEQKQKLNEITQEQAFPCPDSKIAETIWTV